MVKRSGFWLAMVLLLVIGALAAVPATGAQGPDSVPNPVLVVLGVQGAPDFARMGWDVPLPLTAGALVQVGDLVYADGSTAVQVLCPDGSPRQFLASELLSVGDVLDCQVDPGSYVLGDVGMRQIIVQRGGIQSPTVPYLIAPRATVVRTPQVTLRWHPVSGVSHYTLTVRGGGNTWESDQLLPEAVIVGDEARFDLPVALQPGVPYTVDICVLFDDMRTGCTSDPGWASGDVAFYYQDSPVLREAEDRILGGLGAESPESLYARAVLLSQPVFAPGSGEPVGVYQEAVDLLHQLVRDHPGSALATSPEVFNLLGELYRRMALPLDATRAYEQAEALAAPGTESAATAALGRALTTPAGDELVRYDAALAHYAAFMGDAAFEARLAQVCAQAGGLCLQFSTCADRLDECAAWARGS